MIGYDHKGAAFGNPPQTIPWHFQLHVEASENPICKPHAVFGGTDLEVKIPQPLEAGKFHQKEVETRPDLPGEKRAMAGTDEVEHGF
jgi:hypothetical protein